MAIKVIKKKVEMPEIGKRRFKYTCNNGNINSYWFIYDKTEGNRVRKGTFDDMVFTCLQLNKNHYIRTVNE